MVKIAVAGEKQRYCLGIVLLGDGSDFPEVDRVALEKLNHYQTTQRRIFQQGQCVEYARVETVVGVPALEVVSFAAVLKIQKRLDNLIHRD